MKVTDSFSNSEIPQLFKLEKLCFPNGTWTKNTFLRFRDWYRWRIVKVRNKIIAYIAVELTSDKKDAPEIVGVCVHPNYQGFGVASELMRWAEKLVSGQGYDRIQLYVRNDNSAYSLYLKIGYRAQKILKDYYDTAHAIVMVKNLKEK